MFDGMEARDVEQQLAAVCGELNAAHARLAALVAEAVAGELWHGAGLRSAEHWVAWKTGLSPARAAQVVAIARRRDELPALWQAFADGELAVDQVAAVVTRTPAWADAEMCELARHATVSQLRTVAGRYPFDPPAEPSPAQPPQAVQRRVQMDRCTH
jgi:hypothetical protein